MAMAAAMVLMGRRSGSYGCVIQNGEKLETEFIEISMVDLPSGAAKNCVCLFGGFAWTIYCACVVMAAVMVLMGRRSGSYGCAIQNGKKLETEFIEIPMVDLP